MAKDLPPVPAKPQLSPPVVLPGEEPVRIGGASGEPELEALVRAPRGAKRAVLLCHPHPLYGGTMHSAVVLAIAKVLGEKGDLVATLRFNYRGVGTSEGSYDEGRGETDDVARALAELRRFAPSAKVTVCGYSFGTGVGLRAAAADGGVERVTLVAPAVRLFSFLRKDGLAFAGKLTIFVGDKDEFCDVPEAEALAKELDATLTVLPEADHYFMKSRRKLADMVVPIVAPEVA